MKQSLTVRKAEHFGINRKIIANMTAQSWHDIPHVVVTNEPEASEFLNVFKELNEGRAKQDKITLNAVILKVITEALKKCPAMNAHIDFKPRLVRGCVTEFDEINISMPMLLDSGEMMTVNLHNMQDKSLTDIRDTLADVQRRAKNSNMSQVMYDVSLNDTLQGLARASSFRPSRASSAQRRENTESRRSPESRRRNITTFPSATGSRSTTLSRAQ